MHRIKDARIRSGLSRSRAAQMLGITEQSLGVLEESKLSIVGAEQVMGIKVSELAAIYGVNIEWLTGERERYDFSALNSLAGSEDLTSNDRVILAEFIASIPRRPK